MEERIPPKYIFWFVVYVVTIVLGYVFCVTFCHIPKENLRFVDIAFGFLLGTVLGGAIAYLLGGSPDEKKKEHRDVPILPGTTIEETAFTTKTTDTSSSIT